MIEVVEIQETAETGDGLKEFTVATDEKFRVTRTVRAKTALDAAVKALHGCADGQEMIVDQEGIGYIEGVSVDVWDENDELTEFNLDDILSFGYEEEDEDAGTDT